MSNRNKAAKASAAKAQAAQPETQAPVATLATVPPAAQSEAVESEVEVYRSPAQVAAECFKADGEALELIPGSKLKAKELGEFVKQRVLDSEQAGNQAAYALHVAIKHPGANDSFLRDVLRFVDDGTLTASALANVVYTARVLIPFRLEHDIRTPLGVLKDAIASVRDGKTGERKTTPEAIAVLTALQTGKIALKNSAGEQTEVPVTTNAIRALRKQFGKDGQPVAKALPPVQAASATATAPEAEKPQAPAATGITGEIRAENAEKAEATKEQPPQAGSIDTAADARDREFSSRVILPFNSVLAYVREKSVQGSEREIVMSKIRELGVMLGFVIG